MVPKPPSSHLLEYHILTRLDRRTEWEYKLGLLGPATVLVAPVDSLLEEK